MKYLVGEAPDHSRSSPGGSGTTGFMTSMRGEIHHPEGHYFAITQRVRSETDSSLIPSGNLHLTGQWLQFGGALPPLCVHLCRLGPDGLFQFLEGPPVLANERVDHVNTGLPQLLPEEPLL